jgi:hypothetical protein
VCYRVRVCLHPSLPSIYILVFSSWLHISSAHDCVAISYSAHYTFLCHICRPGGHRLFQRLHDLQVVEMMPTTIPVSPNDGDTVSSSPFSTDGLVIVSPAESIRALATSTDLEVERYEDIVVLFGMENVLLSDRHLIWEVKRLGEFFKFSSIQINTGTHESMNGWQFLRQKIASYLKHDMSAMLTDQQQLLFGPEKHLQIYVSTTDKGFHKVLHAGSYERTFLELYKYVKREYHSVNAFEIHITFFSPAFYVKPLRRSSSSLAT